MCGQLYKCWPYCVNAGMQCWQLNSISDQHDAVWQAVGLLYLIAPLYEIDMGYSLAVWPVAKLFQLPALFLPQVQADILCFSHGLVDAEKQGELPAVAKVIRSVLDTWADQPAPIMPAATKLLVVADRWYPDRVLSRAGVRTHGSFVGTFEGKKECVAGEKQESTVTLCKVDLLLSTGFSC